MKILGSLALILMCTSCYVTTYSHSEVMDQTVLGATKEEVITHLGLPDSKQVEGEYEQWTFNRGQLMSSYARPVRTATTASAVSGSRNLYGDVNSVNVYSNTTSYGGRTTTQVYDKYVKLMFKDDIVISWDTQGIDLSEKEPDKAASFAIILTLAAAVVAGLLTFGNGL